ncbi:Nif3-like dinuclear metal center hexameric protein [Alkalicoccobacillus porphyridii]|uniref:GTP cyclohydrolase 1 type 2 homolog n=1 Tax=Alkalicoccobacillus porphyridii TaxID=2597270 RepID=A0A553ZZ83_9BACI|nr:Nif3-like dinuclear metal center hexameric protein [Alkalicoccobacillus porphyridii]TSB46743.1 Nif3-like dinuclear metal center hexameric protein [Alkalicoccobacillus porphyridii]
MTQTTGQDVIRLFEEWAPQTLAVEGDRVGLMVGTLEQPVKRIMTALDVTEEVIDEAINEEVDLILAHHPLLFRPLKVIDTHTTQGRIIQKALFHNITIYAAHTNLDIAEGGVNDMLADALSLQHTRVLAPTVETPLVKLVVFVPTTHAEAVRKAIGDAGAGHIGEYSHCSYSLEGTGTFKPSEASNPFIGTVGEQEYVEEQRIETIVTESRISAVIKAMLDAHPYEEAAYDLYPLKQQGKSYGLGRIGELQETITLDALAEKVKQAFEVSTLRMIGDRNKRIKTVAVLGGDGNKYVQKAMHAGADVLITGDIYYHTAIDAIEDGFVLLDPGHNIEKIMKMGTVQHMRERIAKAGYDEVTIFESNVNTDPYQYK